MVNDINIYNEYYHNIFITINNISKFQELVIFDFNILNINGLSRNCDSYIYTRGFRRTIIKLYIINWMD